MKSKLPSSEQCICPKDCKGFDWHCKACHPDTLPSSNPNDALRSFDIIWSLLLQEQPYWACANTMHADNVRLALELAPDDLQRCVGVLRGADETSAPHEDKADLLSMAALVARIGRDQAYSVPADLLKRASAVLVALADSRTTKRHRGCGSDCRLPAGHLGDHVPPEEPFGKPEPSDIAAQVRAGFRPGYQTTCHECSLSVPYDVGLEKCPNGHDNQNFVWLRERNAENGSPATTVTEGK